MVAAVATRIRLHVGAFCQMLNDLASQLGLGTANNGGGNGSGMVLNAASSGSLAPG